MPCLSPISLTPAPISRLFSVFVKYNAVLRGLNSDVARLAQRFAELCKGNRYTTTLHSINSSIVKLSKLTKASKVYRGIRGGLLPNEFWEPNKYNVCGLKICQNTAV